MKILDSQVTDFVATCQKANTFKDLIKNGADSFKEIGFDNLIYHYIPHLGSPDYNMRKIFHIPKEHKSWLINRFPKHMNISPRDPFEEFVFHTGVAVWTTELKSHKLFQSTEKQAFLEVMQDRFGPSLVVPVYGPRRSRGYFFLPKKGYTQTLGIRDAAFIEYMCSFFHICYARLRTMKVASVSLTPREHEVLQLIPLGLSNREIAKVMKISTYTVNGYMKQLLEKFDASDRVLVAQRAFALDLIE